MDASNSKPFGQHFVHLPGSSIDGIPLPSTEHSLPLHPIPLHAASLPDTPLHSALLGPALQPLAYSGNHFHSGDISRDSPLMSSGGTSANSQPLKKRREDSNGEDYMQNSFRPPPSLRTPISTRPLSPQLQYPQNSDKSFTYNFQLSHPSTSSSFRNLNASSTGMPLEVSPHSPIQKPIPTLLGLNLSAQNNRNGSLNKHQSSPMHAPLAVANLHSSRTSAFYDPSQAADLAASRLTVQSWGNRPLSTVDPLVWAIMEREKDRQCKGIELIASENFTSQAVIEALGSHLTNKYSEGMPGARLYSGNENIDIIENLCIERALKAFHLEPKLWGVNVQPYSCTSANYAVYTALLQPKDRIMGLDSPSGGHLSHGYYTSNRKLVSAASIFFESFPYRVDSTGHIDFVDLERIALAYRPKLLICGASAYPREWNYAKFRDLADRCGAILMCDMAHISGIVAAQQCSSPFEFCDIVTTTTHKSLRGPRGGMIFFRRGQKRKSAADDTDHYDFEAKINFAVSHSVQGGPHNNRTAALAVALLQVDTPEFKAYIVQVLKNAKALAAVLQRRDCKLVTGGTDNHLMLWDLRPHKLTGNQYEKVCEMCGITLNKNAVYGDSGAMAPGGVRIGTPAMTSRGCLENDFETIAGYLLKALQIAQKVRKEYGHAQKGFLKGLQNNKEIEEVRTSVERFASSFEMPGCDTSVYRYNGN